LITQPTLVVNGNRDVMIPTINPFTLSQHITKAQLIIYPDIPIRATHHNFSTLTCSCDMHARF